MVNGLFVHGNYYNFYVHTDLADSTVEGMFQQTMLPFFINRRFTPISIPIYSFRSQLWPLGQNRITAIVNMLWEN